MSFIERCAKTVSVVLIALPLLASCATNYDVDGITDIGDLFGGDDDRSAVTETETTETFVYEDKDFAGSELLLPPDLADTASESLRFRRADGEQDTDDSPDNP